MIALIIVGFLSYNVIGAYVAGRVRSEDRRRGDTESDGAYALPWLLWPLLIVGMVCYRIFKVPFMLGDSYNKRKALR